MDIRFYQQEHYCIHFAKARFTRLVRQVLYVRRRKHNNRILKDYNYENVRISSNALGLLQIVTEAFLVDLLECANKAAIHHNRQTVYPKDVQVVLAIASKKLY